MGEESSNNAMNLNLNMSILSEHLSGEVESFGDWVPYLVPDLTPSVQHHDFDEPQDYHQTQIEAMLLRLSRSQNPNLDAFTHSSVNSVNGSGNNVLLADEQRPHDVPNSKPSEVNNGGAVLEDGVAKQKKEGEEDNADKGGGDNNGGFFDCNICLDMASDPVVTCCGHLFCWSCLYRWLHLHSNDHNCPVCKGFVNVDKVTPIYGRGKNRNSVCGRHEEEDSSLRIPPRPNVKGGKNGACGHGLQDSTLRRIPPRTNTNNRVESRIELHDLVYSGPVHDDLVYSGPVHDDIVYSGPVHDDIVYRGPVHDDIVYRGPVHDDLVYRGPVHDDLVYHGVEPSFAQPAAQRTSSSLINDRSSAANRVESMMQGHDSMYRGRMNRSSVARGVTREFQGDSRFITEENNISPVATARQILNDLNFPNYSSHRRSLEQPPADGDRDSFSSIAGEMIGGSLVDGAFVYDSMPSLPASSSSGRRINVDPGDSRALTRRRLN